jgi:glycosyltransferase involved in cell wall biosynthesis
LLRDAWPAVRAAHPAARLRIVGEGDAEALAPGLGALPGVTLEPRWVADGEMAQVIAAARLVVLPYREASQSGVLPLALALGVPVVATRVGGLAEQFPAGAGALVPPEPGALGAAMARLLEPAAQEAAAAAAHAAGVALTDWRAQAATLRAGLAEVLR